MAHKNEMNGTIKVKLKILLWEYNILLSLSLWKKELTWPRAGAN